jgi:hypothetical protein
MTDQEKEDQFFEERGNMYVGEKTPLWIKIGAILLIPFNLPLWIEYWRNK